MYAPNLDDADSNVVLMIDSCQSSGGQNGYNLCNCFLMSNRLWMFLMQCFSFIHPYTHWHAESYTVC